MRIKIIALLTLGLMIVTWSFFGTCAETEAPSLSVGDQWTYEWMNATGELEGIPRTMTVDRIEDFEGVPCYVLISDIEIGPINMTKTAWMNSNWVILKTEDYEIWKDLEQRVTKVYNPGIKLYDFPLSVGKEWSGRSYVAGTSWWNSTTAGEGTDTGSEYIDWVRKVVATETITVPAGNFDTYIVEELKFGDGTRFWFSVDAKNHVKLEYFGEYYVGEEREVLTSYELATQRKDSLNLPIIVALSTTIGVLGFTSFIYNRRHQNKWDT